MITYSATVQYNEELDEFVVPLTDEICEELGWNSGDTLNWEDNGDGSFTIKKIEPPAEMVLVETISTFRMRYVVQVPAGKREWALDTVTMNEAIEFSQEHIGEQIVSHRVIDKAEYMRVFAEDNNYINDWTDEQKMQYITPLPKDEVVHTPSYFDTERNK